VRSVARAVAQESPDEDLIRLYLQEIGRRTLLDSAEEIRLAKAIEAGTKAEKRLAQKGKLSAVTIAKLRRDVADGERARDTFIEANLRLVVSNARRYQGFGLPLLDLIQDGNVGLLRAVEKFDWRRGFKFSTYATWWIRQGITRGLADRARTIRLPVHVADVVLRLRRVESDLSRELGREPTDEEISLALDIEADKVRAWFATARCTDWRIHQVAYVENLKPRRQSNFSTARFRPRVPSWIRSRNGTPSPR
jgi:RNA polymerase sigma factor (sigma-70 family)